jgi:four helix bundle protein
MGTEELRYRKLEIWRRGVQLVKTVYGLLNAFPKHEQYALADQLKRAAVSVPSNIAEGSKRHTVREFRNFLCIASGSLAEVDTQLVIAHELGYIVYGDELAEEVVSIMKMIGSFSASLHDA